MTHYIYSVAVWMLAACSALSQTQTDAKPGIILREDFQILEGTVEPMRDARNPDAPVHQYRVTTGGYAQLVSARQVLMTGNSRKDAYEYLKKQKKTNVHEDRVWLALWCQKNELVLEGRMEARAALELVPNDKFVQNLVNELDAAKVSVAEDTIRIVRPKPSAVRSATTSVIPPDTLATSINLNSTHEKLYPKVGAILQNQCLKCHETSKMKTGFVLERVPEGTTTGASWKTNMAMAAKYARSTEPNISPLVKYATTPHGGQYEASLTVNHPAAKNLAAWAELFPVPESPRSLITPNDQKVLVPNTAPPVITRPAPVPVTPQILNPNPAPSSAINTTPVPSSGIKTTQVDPNAPKKVKIEMGPGTQDPFDPNEFNKLNKEK